MVPSSVDVMCAGCAFVTFCSKTSAELAQQELHDKTVLPNVSGVMYLTLTLHMFPMCVRV